MRRVSIGESLEARRLLSITPFGDVNFLNQSNFDQPAAIQWVDVDSDNNLDLIVHADDGAQWLRSTEAGFDTPIMLGGPASQFADVNADGHVDQVYFQGLTLVASLNDGAGNFSNVNSSFGAYRFQGAPAQLADVDGDGDLDALLVAQDLAQRDVSFGWTANDGTGRFSGFERLAPMSDYFGGRFSTGAVHDVDDDGDLDVLTLDAGVRSSELAWYETIGDDRVRREVESSGFGRRPELAIETGNDGSYILVESEIDDPSGRRENVVLRFDAALGELGPAAEFESLRSAQALSFVDFDADGTGDVVRLSDGQIDWLRKEDNGQLSPVATVSDGTFALDGFAVADANRDGHLDVAVVGTAFDVVDVYYGTAVGFTPQRLNVSPFDGIEAIHVDDLDQDGKIDVVVQGAAVSWLRTISLGVGAPDVVRLMEFKATDVKLADLDADGRNDVIASDGDSLHVAWNRGAGRFEFTELADSGDLVEVLDWDGDGDLDLVTTFEPYADAGIGLAWYELSQDGYEASQAIGEFSLHPIFQQFPGDDFFYDRVIRSIQVVDVAAGPYSLAVEVERFAFDVRGVFFVGRDSTGATIVSDAAVRYTIDDAHFDMVLADSDGDGDDELFTAIAEDDFREATWHDIGPDGFDERALSELGGANELPLEDVEYLRANQEWLRVAYGRQSLGLIDRFWHDRVIPFAPRYVDVDGDGQTDLLAATADNIVWLTNQTELFDFSQDGGVDEIDIDLLSAAIANEDPNTGFDVDGNAEVDRDDLDYLVTDLLHKQLADINLDGVFDSSDLVLMFQRGKYEIDEQAVWSDGDFDANGRFDSSDLVLALSSSRYVVEDDDD